MTSKIIVISLLGALCALATVRIKGAVPSKIFDILPMGMPIVFCGGGEGARIVENHGVGFTSSPGNYEALKDNLQKLTNMTDEAYTAMSRRCLQVSCSEFHFDRQIDKTIFFINN